MPSPLQPQQTFGRPTIYIVPNRQQQHQQRVTNNGFGPAILASNNNSNNPNRLKLPLGHRNGLRQATIHRPQHPQIAKNYVVRRPVFTPTAAPFPKKQRLDEAPKAELVDIAEVYQLLGEHFGPDQYDQDEVMPQPRKRERLTNLTKEEKLHRRKLKNRVAAQTARDRKKERSTRLESAVRALLQETSRLRSDNAHLRSELNALRQEKRSRVELPEVTMMEEPKRGKVELVDDQPEQEQDTFVSAEHINEDQQSQQGIPTFPSVIANQPQSKLSPKRLLCNTLLSVLSVLSLFKSQQTQSSRPSSTICLARTRKQLISSAIRSLKTKLPAATLRPLLLELLHRRRRCSTSSTRLPTFKRMLPHR